jgi:hypothetical protein
LDQIWKDCLESFDVEELTELIQYYIQKHKERVLFLGFSLIIKFSHINIIHIVDFLTNSLTKSPWSSRLVQNRKKFKYFRGFNFRICSENLVINRTKLMNLIYLCIQNNFFKWVKKMNFHLFYLHWINIWFIIFLK